MTEMLRDFPRICFPVPEKEILFRLGGRSGKPNMSDALLADYGKWIRAAFALCHPAGRSRIVGIREFRPDGILLENDLFLPGGAFARSVPRCRKLWCAAATIGQELVLERDRLESAAEKSVFDAVGSECADAAMDFLHRQAMREFPRRGESVDARRYSPGYGDMPLTAQKLFFELLDLEDLGLSLSRDFFIVPEKTVTAWAGIVTLGE